MLIQEPAFLGLGLLQVNFHTHYVKCWKWSGLELTSKEKNMLARKYQQKDHDNVIKRQQLAVKKEK